MDVIERINKIDKSTYDFSDGDGGPLTLSRDDLNDLLHLAKLGKQMQWVSVADRLPSDGELVLICTVNKNVKVLRLLVGENRKWRENNSKNLWFSEVTHWIPLPPAPYGVE